MATAASSPDHHITLQLKLIAYATFFLQNPANYIFGNLLHILLATNL